MPSLYKPAYLADDAPPDDADNGGKEKTTIKPIYYNMKILNNLGFSDESIEEVKTYILSKRTKTPARLDTNSKIQHFRKKWKDFIYDKGHLVYEPVHLIVIPDHQKEKVLADMYSDLTAGVGAGIRLFYYQVISHYLNIRRGDVESFLKKQKTYQLTRPVRHIVNKPILATKPNERWCIDLVEMNRYADSNRGYIYIMTCIDYFSRFVWATPLKRKLAEHVVAGMNKIVDVAKGVFPRILMADNGGEFQGALNTWCRTHDIKKIKTQSYTPQSNGLVENFNGQLRKMLREIMIRNHSLNWVDYLQTCCDNKNSQRNSTIKARPIDVWEPSHAIPEDNFIAENIRERAKKQVEKNKTAELAVGQLVRVKMSALYSQIRKIIKAGKGDAKYLAVKYSPEIFKVAKVLEPDNAGYEKLRYYLEDLEGNPTITQLKRNAPNRRRERQRFFATDLLPVDSSSVDENDKDGFDNTQAHYINRLDEATATDKARRRPPKPTRPARQRRQTPPKPADDDPAVQPERLQEIERQVADLTAKQLSAVVTGDVVKNAELAKTMRGMSENEKMALLKSGADRITRSRAKTGSGIMIGGSFYDWK